MKVSVLYVGLFGLSVCSAYSVDYTGFQQWRVKEINDGKELIGNLKSIIDEYHLDIVSSKRSSIDFLVEPHLQNTLDNTLKESGFRYDIIVDDLQRLIDDESRQIVQSVPSSGINISTFNDYETITTFMHELSDIYDWVTIESIGKSFEGRDLWVNTLAVSKGKREKQTEKQGKQKKQGKQVNEEDEVATNKPFIWIDCGIHSREWLSHSTCVFGLDYLTKSYSHVDEVTQLLDKYDVKILSVYNPDGYVYSWQENRNWRKNRALTIEPLCPGVDLNRNLDDGHWDGPYSGTFVCDIDYRGPSAFSEPETVVVRDYITNLETKPTAYFNLHTCVQMWLYPYGFTADLPPDHEELDRVTKIGVEALESMYGTHYDYGPVYSTIYPVNGDVIDWSYLNGINYSFVLELRGPSFVVPTSEIVPTGEETWAGMIAAILAI